MITLLNALPAMLINGAYATGCIVLGLIAMIAGYKIFDKLTPYDTGEELKNMNIAVAIFNGAIVLGVGLCSAIVIGMACN
jgi:uncharacterized membrane protein YjfL (UPF0719 family)